MKTKGEEAAEDEMVRAHHQLKGHEFEQTPEDSEGEGSLCAAVHGVGHDLSDWTTLFICCIDTSEYVFLKPHIN